MLPSLMAIRNSKLPTVGTIRLLLPTVILLLSFSTGCATAKLSRGPDTYALSKHPDGIRLGVNKVVDERNGDKVGTIGAAIINVKRQDLANLATNYLISQLNTSFKANIEEVAVTAPEQIPAEAEKRNVKGLVLARISHLRMFSMDAIMQPVKVELNMEAELYDAGGQLLFNKSFPGNFEKRIGISLVEHSTGQLVEATVRDAVSNLVKDTDFKTSVASLRKSQEPA